MILKERDAYFKILEKLRISFNLDNYKTLNRSFVGLYKSNRNLIKFCDFLTNVRQISPN